MCAKLRTLPKGALNAAQRRFFFIDNLNRIYFAKSHLQVRMPELGTHMHFTDLPTERRSLAGAPVSMPLYWY
jgi:hypothetical protein